MKIYLIRHGQTDWNHQFLIQGQTNNELNATGKSQAQMIAPFFDNIKPTHLISSPLLRACQTMEIIKNYQHWDQTITIEKLLTERNFGALEACHVDQFYAHTDVNQVHGFETNQLLEQRVTNLMKQLATLKQDDIIVITTHSHTIKAFLTLIDNTKFDYSYKLKNCAIIEIDHTNSYNVKNIH